MGKIKRDMKKIHSKKVKRAKKRLKAFRKNDVTYQDLSRLAKKMLEKQRKRKKEQES